MLTPDPLISLLKQASEIEEKIGYNFNDKKLLTLAFIHRSFVNENRSVDVSNERLEFLGDSVLGILMSDYLYHHFPDKPEGDLSYLRSRLVEADSCVTYIQKLDIAHYLLLGKGERQNESRGRITIMADLFEAIIGAIYLDGGFASASKFIFENFSEDISHILKTPVRNWKAMLQDYCQKQFQKAPQYKVLSETGPEHNKEFLVAAYLGERELGRGKGASKKEAQQSAATNALSFLT